MAGVDEQLIGLNRLHKDDKITISIGLLNDISWNMMDMRTNLEDSSVYTKSQWDTSEKLLGEMAKTVNDAIIHNEIIRCT